MTASCKGRVINTFSTPIVGVAEYCDERVCLSATARAYLRNYIRPSNFCACYLGP